MLRGHPQICLFQPEIPQNAGSIARLAAATQCRLHLVKPFGFNTEDRNLRRPGLDYWPFLDLEIHDDFATLAQQFAPRVAFFSKKATRSYLDMPPETELLVFGRETDGLPAHIWDQYSEHFYSIPIFHAGVRSLNLANSVAICVYELMRQRHLLPVSQG